MAVSKRDPWDGKAKHKSRAAARRKKARRADPWDRKAKYKIRAVVRGEVENLRDAA